MVESRQVWQGKFTAVEIAELLKELHIASMLQEGLISEAESIALAEANARYTGTVDGGIKLILDPVWT